MVNKKYGSGIKGVTNFIKDHDNFEAREFGLIGTPDSRTEVWVTIGPKTTKIATIWDKGALQTHKVGFTMRSSTVVDFLKLLQTVVF